MPPQIRQIALLLTAGSFCSPLVAQSPPGSIDHLYRNTVDPTVSDDFDSATLDTSKWGYRAAPTEANWLQSNVTLKSIGADHYLNLRGGWNRAPDENGVITGTGSSSGVYSRNASGFGFYTARWRVEGISPTQKSSWHPAIWKANVKPIPGWPRDGLPVDQIENDFVEFNQNRTQNIHWHSQAIDWTRDSQGGTQSTRIQHSPWSSDFQDTFWNTHGLEYHPDYIQLWDFDEAAQQWSQRGARITISEAETSEAALNINRDSAHPGYWILSNYDFFDRTNDLWIPFHGRPIMDTDNFLMGDSALQIDHFRFYPFLNGDFDGNGAVGIEDYDLWRTTYGDAVLSGAGADGNGDGRVDAADFTVWRESLTIPPQLATATPEPASLPLALCAIVAHQFRHRAEAASRVRNPARGFWAA